MSREPLDHARALPLVRVPAVGEEGLRRLAEARILAVGASGAAAPGLLLLAMAGVGTIWLDDPEPVAPSDAGRWLFPPSSVGERRERVVAEALRARRGTLSVGARPEEGTPTAVLVQAPSLAQATAAADRARKGGIPHVVVESDGDGGSIVLVPVGGPCFTCARSAGSVGRPPGPGAAALSALAAAELISAIVTSRADGRRTDLVRGIPAVRLTTRLAGCACATDAAR